MSGMSCIFLALSWELATSSRSLCFARKIVFKNPYLSARFYWGHRSKTCLVQRARKYMYVDKGPNHFHIYTFIPLITGISFIHLSIYWSIYLPIHPSAFLPIYHLSQTMSSHGVLQAQSNTTGFILACSFFTCNSLLSKWESCLQHI